MYKSVVSPLVNYYALTSPRILTRPDLWAYQGIFGGMSYHFLNHYFQTTLKSR
jgi:hypothetical protein